MQLSAFTDYSLRVLIYVGLRPKDRTSIADVANAYRISRNHVDKVVVRLQQLGYLKTFRGRSGGVELGCPPEQVRVGKLVSETENLQLVECMKPIGECVLSGPCVLQHALAEARDAFLSTLDQYTLADLLRPSTQLAVLLSRE
jgi:Rrf2 family nitric oxide-sensitive transcriptional repressor